MTEEIQQKEVKLTAKEARFVEYYFHCWNKTEAARKAGYAWPDRNQYRLMQKPYIAAAIAERMKELAMETDEILLRLTQQAQASIADFFEFEEGVHPTNGKKMVGAVPNWDKVKEYGYLIKKIELTRDGNWKIELNDPQNALVQLGRARKLFVDRSEVDVNTNVKAYVGISPDDWDEDEGDFDEAG